jgi:succinate dehydrogenase / fumarate reductase, flavoprotein subunit
MANGQRIAVIGGGLAGLGAAMKIAEMGVNVDLFSICPVKRSHSVCAQGGINAALDAKGEGDSPEQHFYDTIYGGDFLANQTPIKKMCYDAPDIIYLLDRMGVQFNRTIEKNIDIRGFGGAKFFRTVFSGASTGQQILYALDEQVRMYHNAGRIKMYEFWEFLSIILDSDGVCRGLTAIDVVNMEVKSFAADAVVMATGGPSIIFGKTTNSMINTGGAAARVYQQGAKYANAECIQVHPTAMQGVDKFRLMSESARGEGGRVWTPRDPFDKRDPASIPEADRWFFLEEKYPRYGNLVPRDIATREIFDVCVNQHRGIKEENQVYLDVSHLPDETKHKLAAILDIYEKFTGVDPTVQPMKIFPAVHYSMGGLWVDYDQMTNIPGLFAAGEVDYEFHGGNRLGANSLLSCVWSGLRVAGPKSVEYVQGLEQSAAAMPSSMFDDECKKQAGEMERITRLDGPENPYVLWREMGDSMNAYCTVVKNNADLQKTDNLLSDLMARAKNIGLPDKSAFANESVLFARRLTDMMKLARVIVRGSILRDESRGAHYKPEFPERNDEKFLKTSLAEDTPDGPKFSDAPVDIQFYEPVKRQYATDITEKKKDA